MRGLKQKMFLLGANKKDSQENNWNFKVKGTTNDYNIDINSTEINCSCPDFQTRGRICKHLYFIIGRIAQCEDMLVTLESDIEKGDRGSFLNETELNLLSCQLMIRLIQRLSKLDTQKRSDNPQVNMDEDCTICYEELKIGELVECRHGNEPSCHNYFHKDCIQNWLEQGSGCPLCRRIWVSFDNNNDNNIEYDPLDKLNNNEIKIKWTY